MFLNDSEHMEAAYQLALKSYREGGCPIGSLIVDQQTGEILGRGHNMLVQEGNPIIHGEMSAMRDAGRIPEKRANATLYTTLSPCMMCAGTILQFQLPRIVIGDIENSPGNADLLRAEGKDVVILPHRGCIELVQKFRKEKPELWNEDWGQPV